jgi:putative PIG3 family NAD(P)H quinone oxidoreductase
MRAVEILHPGPEGRLEVRKDYPKPTPGPEELLVKVAYTALNRADIFQKQGKYPPPEGASPLPGLEVSGVVEACGEKVQGWEKGTPLCALLEGGGYAEYATVPAGQLLPVPEGWTLREAAALPEALFTLWLALFENGKLQAKENILIHGGASGIGHMAIQMAKAAGAIPFATVGSADKQAFCQQLGCAETVNYHDADFQTYWGKNRFDLILDIVGGPYMQKNITLLKPYGRLVNLAFLQGSKAELNMANLLFKQASWHGMTLRSRAREYKAYLAEQIRANVWGWLEDKVICPYIFTEFPLDEAEKAHATMQQNLNLGKILLKVGD